MVPAVFLTSTTLMGLALPFQYNCDSDTPLSPIKSGKKPSRETTPKAIRSTTPSITRYSVEPWAFSMHYLFAASFLLVTMAAAKIGKVNVASPSTKAEFSSDFSLFQETASRGRAPESEPSYSVPVER